MCKNDLRTIHILKNSKLLYYLHNTRPAALTVTTQKQHNVTVLI